MTLIKICIIFMIILPLTIFRVGYSTPPNIPDIKPCPSKVEGYHHFSEDTIINPKVIEKIEYHIIYNSRYSNEMKNAIDRSEYWFPKIDKILKKKGIPSDFKYLAFSESYLRNDSSGCGAKGFWQITKNTGISIGLTINDSIDQRLDPIISTYKICDYINNIKKQNPSWSWSDVAMSYNMGENAYLALKNKHINKDMFLVYKNKETNNYMYRILSLKEIIKNKEKYNLD